MSTELSGWSIVLSSIVETSGATYFLARDPQSRAKSLGVSGDASGFEGGLPGENDTWLFPLSPENAAALRQRLPWLRPAPLGLQTSAGFGDRLGLATPGHVQAVRGTGIAPVFAQQSVRENARTGRTPQQVLDEAMWGAFEAGWREPWGADADHLKTLADLEPFVAAGYSFFTVDPGEHVDSAAESDTPAVLKEKVSRLPWEALHSSPQELYREYLEHSISLGSDSLQFDEAALLRAAAKYGHALAHTAGMYQRLVQLMDPLPFDFELSVDETDTPTSVHEHYFIASQLKRLGVQWTSLAPRFTGRFEKGVDYIGDLQAFEAEFKHHAAVMNLFGSYKLGLHSGSDKFSIYPIFAAHTRGRAHVKTAGTSYLEALRLVARLEPGLFREILAFARDRYEIDRASYHVSAQLSQVPAPQALQDGDLPALLDQFDARQVLHVTFGSALGRFGQQLRQALANNEVYYAELLEAHFAKHLKPFQTHLSGEMVV